MLTANQYRQYAADCRRMAETMTGSDRETLLKMAQLWEERAQEAEQRGKKDEQP